MERKENWLVEKMNTPSSSSLFYRLLFVFVVFVVLCPCDARRPRAFIHIGPHKTGSTTIQTTLSTLYDQVSFLLFLKFCF